MKKFLLCVLVLAALFSPLCSARAKTSDTLVALDFRLTGLDNKAYSLADYKGKGNVLLFFWTTWCPFCREELKKLNAKSAELAKDNITVLAVNVGEPREKVERYIGANDVKFTVLFDEDTTVSDTYGIMGVPTFFLVNKIGMVVFSNNYFPDDYKGILPKN
ncbi:MAG: TlpA disulfide reductase family protein [Candidatus Omnitrophica bacterium]|nr:TlpA disulfide reductase family protein [Candidatus Omnitrophota bacterium]